MGWGFDGKMSTMASKLLAHGAHVTSVDNKLGELLWLSPVAKLDGPGAIRGGVPIIGPWFAALTGQEPKHGWARVSQWQLIDDATARITKDGLELQVVVVDHATGFTMTYSARNVGDESRKIQLAFHPYFRVADVEKVTVSGVDGADVYDAVTKTHVTQQGDLTFTSGEYDRITRGGDYEYVISDPGLRRRIIVSSSAADSVVVWNPGENTIADIGDKWRHFVCVEPALLGEDYQGVVIEPGGNHTISLTVQTEAF